MNRQRPVRIAPTCPQLVPTTASEPGWVPDPANYDTAMWTSVGYPNGPSTYAELLDGGKKIKDQLGVPLGLGMLPNLTPDWPCETLSGPTAAQSRMKMSV